MKLQFEPLDPLFFRDGRPFALGEETYAEGIFPPLPSTIRGALRSMWISQQLGLDGANKNMLAKASASIALSYFGLAIAGKPVFPAPVDLFFTKKGNPAQPMRLIKPNFSSSCPTEVSYLFKAEADGKTESVAGHLLDISTMKRYIEGGTQTNFETKRISDFSKKEHKIGIGRNNDTHRTIDGLLFRLVANRFEDTKEGGLGFLVDVDGFESLANPLSNYAVTPLGGERRSVAVKQTDFSLPPKPLLKGKRFKIYLITPALLDSWYPKHLCEENPGLKLVAANIGKPISVGGWDVLNQRPKPMRRAVPAGSIFLFEANDEKQANDIAQKYHGQSICMPTDDLDGLGICFIAQLFDNQKIQ